MILTGMIAWILVTYVPAFHSGLPPTLQTFLPWAVSALLGAAASESREDAFAASYELLTNRL